MLYIRMRVRLGARAQRRRDRAWLATGPSQSEIMVERNRRQMEWMRFQVGQMGED